MRTGVIVAVAVASVARCGACEPDRPGDTVPLASVSAAGPVAPPSSSGPVAPSSAATPMPRPRLACRAVSLEGDVHLEGVGDAGTFPVLLQGLIPAEGWLGVAGAAHITAKDPRTTRETAFRGPARVRACVDYSEESWVAAGGFDSQIGAGEAPGNEEWVVTPLGVVRYNAAKLAVDVRPRDATLAVASGTAFVWPAEDARAQARGGDAGPLTRDEEGWLRLDGGTLVMSSAVQPVAIDGAKAAVARCDTLGKAAHDLSAVLMVGGADAATIMQQVSTRRLAKAACAVASLRVSALAPSDATAGLSRLLAEGKAGYAALPSPPPP